MFLVLISAVFFHDGSSFDITTAEVVAIVPLSSFLPFVVSIKLVRFDPIGLKAITERGFVITSSIWVAQVLKLKHSLYLSYYVPLMSPS